MISITQEIQTRLNSSHLMGSRDFTGLESIYDSKRLVEESLDELLPGDLVARQRILDEFFGYGPLEVLLKDETITELIVTDHQSIWCERLGRFAAHSDGFHTEATYRNCLMRLCEESGIQVNLERPMVNGRWRGFRVNITHTSLCSHGTQLSLRSHPESPWNFEKLLAVDWAGVDEIAGIEKLVAERKNILVIGPTGSGKTSVLNACLQCLKDHERVVIIEDCDEIKAPNRACSKLLTREDPSGQLKNVTQADLVKQSLRMRPDRLVLGEIRGEEAKDLLMALSTGHEGSLGSLHASDPKQALLRLEMLIQLGAPQWNLQAVRNLIHLSLDYILLAERDEQGQRRFGGLYRIASLESSGFLVEKVGELPAQGSTIPLAFTGW